MHTRDIVPEEAALVQAGLEAGPPAASQRCSTLMILLLLLLPARASCVWLLARSLFPTCSFRKLPPSTPSR